jgi:hypothetical protein
MNKGGAGGPSARVIAFPRNRRSAGQQLVRGLFSGLSSAFRSLLPAEIDAWNAAANNTNSNALRVNVFGDQKTVTGSQLFQRVNNILASIGLPAYSSPPIAGTTDAITAATLVATFTGSILTLAIATFGGATTVPANTYVRVFATSQRNSSISSFGESQYRFIGFYPATTAINPLDIEADYVARFGALVAGSRLSVKAHFVFDDGAGTFSKGGDVYASAVVGA